VQLLDVIDLGPGGSQAVQAWLPRFEFLLDDLTRAGEDQLLAREHLSASCATWPPRWDRTQRRRT
jgi:hypothetical protein